MKTSEPRLLCVEVVADLPVLWALLQRLDLPCALDRLFPTPRNWKGPLTPGEVLAVWLLFILSRGDHCLSHVLPWVQQHQRTLSALLGKHLLPVHFHDDRLADWLDRLAAADCFAALEQQLNGQTIRVYQLPTDTVRIDTTTANCYADVLSEQGLLQFGHSKDDPDRPQFKIAAAVLDPLGMPLATAVVPGNTSDDPLYIPAIASVRQSLGSGGRTYVGDCKMAALATRAFVAAEADFYLCPLSEKQLSRAERRELLRGVFDGTVALQSVSRGGREAEPEELVAQGFCLDVELTAQLEQQQVQWTERRWLVRSVAYAQGQQEALDRRLASAEASLHELVTRKQGKKQLFHAELMEAAQAIVKREGVEGLLSYQATARIRKTKKRAYRDRPAREETEVFFEIQVQREEEAIEQKKREMGWQVYSTNGLHASMEAVVWAYRGQYRIENDWSRLKGRPLGLTPVYLQDEERIVGLVYLLSLALRVLSLAEWQVRERLQKECSTIQGVYAGQASRKSARPSAELLLEVMKTISFSVVVVNSQTYALLSPLSDVQKRLLLLWDLPPDLYENVRHHIQTTHPNTSEP
jgi:transposase